MSTRNSLFVVDKASNTPSLFYLKDISTACRDVDYLSPPQGIILVHYVDDIMPTGLRGNSSYFQLSGKACVYQSVGENTTKIQETSTSVKFLGIQKCGIYSDIFF